MPIFRLLTVMTAAALLANGQSESLKQGPYRTEITLERLEGKTWQPVDPGLVLEQNDRVRFRFRTNFDGYLYVMNHSTSGQYEQLFPREETGTDNRVHPEREYLVPATEAAFRIAGPAGHEIVYWIVTPAELVDTRKPGGYQPLPPPPPRNAARPPVLIPRCDDVVLRARGDCIDDSAGPKMAPRGDLPDSLAGIATQNPRDLVILRQKDATVVSSQTPLTAPVIYEFRLAHK